MPKRLTLLWECLINSNWSTGRLSFLAHSMCGIIQSIWTILSLPWNIRLRLRIQRIWCVDAKVKRRFWQHYPKPLTSSKSSNLLRPIVAMVWYTKLRERSHRDKRRHNWLYAGDEQDERNKEFFLCSTEDDSTLEFCAINKFEMIRQWGKNTRHKWVLYFLQSYLWCCWLLLLLVLSLMIMDQQVSSNNDSCRVLMTALAGAEIGAWWLVPPTGNIQAAECWMVRLIIWLRHLVLLRRFFWCELLLNGTDAGKFLDQAYTCVKITMKSQDFIRRSSRKISIEPLRATGSFNKISIEWYRRDE